MDIQATLAGIESHLGPGIGEAILNEFAEFSSGGSVPASLTIPGLGVVDARVRKVDAPIPFHVPGVFEVIGDYSKYRGGGAILLPEFSVSVNGLTVGVVLDLAKTKTAADAGFQRTALATS